MWRATTITACLMVLGVGLAGCGASPDNDRPTEMVFYGGRTEAAPLTSSADTRSAAAPDEPLPETAHAPPPAPEETAPQPEPEPAPDATPDQPRVVVVSAGVQLATFNLPDQFNRPHTVTFPDDRPIVIAVGDRDGSPQLDGWTEPLWERFGDSINIHGIALLDSIDPLFRGFVAGVIRHQRPDRPVLLDWTGDVTRPLDCQQAVANIFVVDRSGRVRLQAIGKQTPTALDRLSDQIERIIGE